MTEHWLWSDDPTPALPDNSDGGAAGVVLATGCLFGPGGEIVGVRFRASNTVGAGDTYSIAVWDYVSQELLASKAFGSGVVTAGQWNRLDFDTPLSVDDSHAYVVGIWQSAGRYVATVNYFASHNEGSLSTVYAWGQNEDISSVVAGVTVAKNGQSRVDSALAIPNNFPGNGYFVTPVWEDSPSSGTTYPVTLDPTAVASATSLSVHVVRRVALAPVVVTSGTSLRFTAPAYTRRGGVLVQTTLRGAVKRAGQSLAFG